MPETRRDVSVGDPSVVLDVAYRSLFHTVLLIGLYLHMAGHNQPGGGFIAGLVVGTALVLQFITGRPGVHAPLPLRPEMMMGLGILFAGGMGITSLVLGNSLLEHHTWEFEIAVLGEIKATSALIFDTGVLFVVVGVIATLLEILGSEGDDPDGVTPEEATR
ncbi:MAG: MnhB domain-containing protein [Actinomycetota bacterium]